MKIGVLGPLFVTDGGNSLPLGGLKQRTLLALLIASAGEAVSVPTIVDGVWGDHAPGAVNSSIQSYVSHLRSDVQLDIERVGDAYRLNLLSPTTVDSTVFETLVSQARNSIAHDLEAAEGALGKAFEKWRGEPYGDLHDLPALESSVRWLENLYRQARELEIDVSLSQGENTRAIMQAETLSAQHPFQEDLRAKHMVALYRNGRQADALALYQNVRRLLIDELGVEPGPDLQTVERQILVHDPTLRLVAADNSTQAAVRNPYKGAEAFGQGDATDFFGRDAEIAELVKLAFEHQLSMVVGPSGSGKSSLVKAGLLPTLAKGALPGSADWPTAVIRPGLDPRSTFEQALERLTAEQGSSRRLLLIIDQFEEIYSLADDTERAQFLDAMIDALDEENSELWVLVTLRADFFHLPLMDGRLGPRLRAAHLALAVPGPAELTMAVEGPAANVGLTVDREVSAQIVADVKGEPAALPLLQFTLTELAQTADGGRIDMAAYRKHGGVLGAIGHRAAAVFAELDGDAQEATRRVFLNLVTVIDEGVDVRRRVQRADLERLGLPDNILSQVLNRFAGSRLLSFDHDPLINGATVEVAHEAVLQEWPLLSSWIDDHRQNLVIHRRVQEALSEWTESGRVDEQLPESARLAQFEEWLADPDNNPSDIERLFLTRAIERREENEQRGRRRRGQIMGLFAAAAIVASVLAVLAWSNGRTAERQTELADARALILEAEQNIDVDPELAIMLAAEAIDAYDDAAQTPARATDVLRQALAANKVVGRIPAGWAVAFNVAGDRMYTQGTHAGEVAIWDPISQQHLATVPLGEDHSVKRLVVTNDDRLMAITERGSVETTMSLVEIVLQWDGQALNDANVETLFDYDKGDVEFVGFDVSPDGSRAAVMPLFVDVPGPLVSVAEVWDLESGERLFVVDDVWSHMLAFSTDSQMLAYRTSSPDVENSPHGVVKVVDSSTGADHHVFETISFSALGFRFSPDDTQLVYVDQDQMGLLDLSTGAERWFQPDISRTLTPVWTDDGQTILAGAEGLMSRVSAKDGSLLSPLLGTKGIIIDYARAAGTDLLAVAGTDETTLIDMSEGLRDEVAGFEAPIPVASSSRFDASGRILTSDFGDEFAMYTLGTTEPARILQLSDTPNSWQFPRWSPDRTLLASFDGTSDVVRRIDDWSELYRAPDDWAVRAVTDDASKVVLSQDGQPVRLLETASGNVLHEFDVGRVAHGVEFVAEDRYLYTNNNDFEQTPMWRIWDTESGDLINTMGRTSDDGAIGFAMTSDERYLVLGRYDGELRIYDNTELLDGTSPEDALIRSIDAHEQFIVQIEISPDDELLYSNSWDEPAKVWRLDSGEKVAEFGGSGQITSLAFDPNEPHVYVTDAGYVSVHNLNTDDLVEAALATLTRPMVEEECMLYLGRSCDSDP